ncbi:YiiX/YebB-like N1pC/P60 family cysteine hydrolase [Nannocystaceae bacterium ST9]
MSRFHHEPSPRQLQIGVALDRVGTWLLPACIGAAAGFYAADQGMRWLPTMLGILLLAGAFALLAGAAGRAMQGQAFHVTPKGLVVRKRVLAAVALAVVGGALRLVLFMVQQSSPLTELSIDEFETTFELDGASYREYDGGIEHYLTLLEARPELFVDEHVLTADEERLLLDAWVAIYDYSFALDQVRIFYEDWYRFDPSRAQRSQHLRSFLLTFAAELALYEKSARVVGLFKRNRNVVKFLDAPHPEQELSENTFSIYRQELQGTRDASRVLAGEQYLKVLATGLHGRSEARSLGANWLWQRVEHHLALIDELDLLMRTDKNLRADLEVLKRGVRRVWYPAQKGVAEWMGDTRIRRVGWYLIDEELWGPMEQELEPGDIMLSRKNWYLSNVGLPGFWPHAILYVGDHDKFAAYFDDPEVLAWVAQVSGEAIDLPTWLSREYPAEWLQFTTLEEGQPYRVIEAISEGVSFSPMDHVVGDYVVALRPKLDKLSKAQAIVAAFGYLGRPYDFDFDFATDHALVCTELVWRAYRPATGKSGLELPLVEMAGRPTLPANDIARFYVDEWESGGETQLEFVYFIDAIERERRAVVSSEEEFRTTPERTKWDLI